MEVFQESQRIEAYQGKMEITERAHFLVSFSHFIFETGSLIVEDNLELLICMPKLIPQTQIEWILTIGRGAFELSFCSDPFAQTPVLAGPTPALVAPQC